MVIICKALLMKGYNAVTLFPFIILRQKELKNNPVLLNHERIHLKQQFLEFLVWVVKYKNWNRAYRTISFEQEAYRNESCLTYLKDRPLFAFLKFY